MPPESRARVAERSAELHNEVEGLKALRKLELRVTLPGAGVLKLTGLGELEP